MKASLLLKTVMKNQTKFFPILLIIVCLGFPYIDLTSAISADLKYKLTPKTIIHQISIRGARAVVNELNETDNGNPWAIIVSKIEKGKPEWIEVAKKLRSGTDAGYAEDLDFALSMALVNSPQLLLEMSNIDCNKTHGFCIDDICGNNFIEGDDKSILKILQKRKRSVEKISIAELKKKRDRCISLLEIAIIDISKTQKEDNK